MRLVVRAGSLQERPEEAGIAHLIEHMAFEGTEHFGPQEIVSFLESNGMKFGNELNASTTMTSTQYFLNLPSGDPAVLEKGLAVLSDWTRGPKVKAEYLEKEKKIIIEEERLRRKSAQGRMQVFLEASFFEGSAYAEHDHL
jgi:zinc protease